MLEHCEATADRVTVYTSRNEPSILDAFKANPYTQSLASSA
jgi:hypothetical protein